MEQDLKKEIKKIISEMHCPREFHCLETQFDKSRKTKDVGLETYLEILAKEAPTCPFVVSYGSAYYCSCPLGIHISKNLGK